MSRVENMSMLEELQQIGARIRGLREIMEVSAETLATYLQIPLATLTEYESGRSRYPGERALQARQVSFRSNSVCC